MICFGPIPSRRLGRSLGINNIVAPKTCSYSCVYCQVGRTKRTSVIRESFFSPDAVYNAVMLHLGQLAEADRPDYLTFVSNGEPTLDKNLGKSIARLKAIGIPVAVITNGTMLTHQDVAEELATADWVSVKFDAADHSVWKNINRPSVDLNFENILTSVFAFFKNYPGILCTETMLVKGINDHPDHLFRLAGLIKNANPSKAYIAIPTRPPAEKNVSIPDVEALNIAWQTFSTTGVSTEFLTGFEGTGAGSTGNIYDDILNITTVHPLREDTMMSLLEKDTASWSVVDSLINQRLIKEVLYEGKRYFLRQYNV